MPDRKDRRSNMISMMKRLGIETYRFVEPIVSPPGLYPKLPGPYASLNATVTEKIFGMQRGKTGPFLVFEDDAIERLDPREVVERLALTIESLPPSWDMVYLEYCLERCSFAHRSKPLVSAYKPYCTAAMLYNSSSIDKIRSCLLKVGQLVDFSYVSCIGNGSLKALVANPALFAQDPKDGAGDLKHLDWTKPQYYMNFILRMYPEPGESDSKARLPMCWNSTSVLEYVRWANVMIIIILVVAIFVAIKCIIHGTR